MYYEIENLKMNVEIRGEGRPVLIIHGLGGNLETMKVVFEAIFAGKSGYKRIYLDLPGMGKSNAPLEFASSDGILEVLIDFAKAAIAEPFAAIGYSYGGYLVRALATQMPELLEGLMLLAPMVLPARQARILPESLEWYEKRAEFFAKEYQKADSINPDSDFLDKLEQNYSLSFDLDAQAREQQFYKASLIVLGHQDGVVGFEDQIRFLQDYPRSGFAVLDLASHNLQLEQPVLLASLTKNWLERYANEI